jgi:hypothetical protein
MGCLNSEKVIPAEAIREYSNLTGIPFAAMDAVIHQPYGGYPEATYRFY